MPLLKTVEKIFIGYSQPQAVQRDITKKVIHEIDASNHHKSLQLFVCEYRQLVVDSIPLQHGIDRTIETCDLAILLFGATVGEGLAYEAQYTLKLLKTGQINKLLPYVFDESTPVSPGVSAVEELYNSNQVLFYRIGSNESYESRLREHLGQWLAEEESIVERQKDFLRRGLWGRFAIEDVAFDDEIIAHQRTEEFNLAATGETEAAYRRFIEQSSQNRISDHAFEHYLVARHLRDAVLNDRSELFEEAEFINPIHQIFATLIRHGEADVREAVIDRLESWLEARQKLSESTRSFAVFQLGMLQSRRSSDLLIRTVENKSELQSIRHYAAHALGMLRQRSLIQRMMQAHSIENSPLIKETLTNSIIYMMGVIE